MPPPVLPDGPTADSSDGLVAGEDPPEIPDEDTSFTDTGTEGDLVEDPVQGAGASSVLASGSLMVILSPAILLGALGL